MDHMKTQALYAYVRVGVAIDAGELGVHAAREALVGHVQPRPRAATQRLRRRRHHPLPLRS